jgi:uncharacterized iron-regulated membrane protein
MRRLHRWVSTCCVLFLAWIAITGAMISIDTNFPPPGMGGAAADATPLLGMSNDTRVVVHNFLKEVHSGSIIGLPGRVLSLLSGFSLIFLSVTGIVMYFDMKRSRDKLGRHGIFWR